MSTNTPTSAQLPAGVGRRPLEETWKAFLYSKLIKKDGQSYLTILSSWDDKAEPLLWDFEAIFNGIEAAEEEMASLKLDMITFARVKKDYQYSRMVRSMVQHGIARMIREDAASEVPAIPPEVIKEFNALREASFNWPPNAPWPLTKGQLYFLYCFLMYYLYKKYEAEDVDAQERYLHMTKMMVLPVAQWTIDNPPNLLAKEGEEEEGEEDEEEEEEEDEDEDLVDLVAEKRQMDEDEDEDEMDVLVDLVAKKRKMDEEVDYEESEESEEDEEDEEEL